MTDDPSRPDAAPERPDEPGAIGAPGPKATPPEHRRSVRNAAMLTAGFGIAFSLLYYLAVWLTSGIPNAHASDQEFIDFYNSGNATPVTLGLYVMPFSVISFIWFIVALRMWSAASATRTASILQSNLQFVSGVAFVIVTGVAAAAASVVAVSVQLGGGVVDPAIARQFPVFSSVLHLFFGMRMAAMFVFTTSSLARRAGILPSWFVYLGFLVGLFLLLTAIVSPILVIVFPTWVLVLCLLLLREARRIPSDLRLPAPAPVGFRRPIDFPTGQRSATPPSTARADGPEASTSGR